MIEEAITRAESFSVMYTPCVTQVNAEKVDTLKEAFTKKHPDYVEYISTGDKVAIYKWRRQIQPKLSTLFH